MRTSAAYVCCLILACLVAPVSAAEWVRVETSNFIVFGQVGEKRTKEVAAEFERFREAIGQVLSTAAVASAVPTTVVVFENQRAFAPYSPTYNGKPVMVGGYFMWSESDNTIALTVEDRDNALRIIFHEYTHLITSNSSRVLPAWVNEGLAEFYSTFAVAPDGQGGVLGKAIPGHHVLLGRSALLPLEQLLTVDHSSALYNEGQRRSIFYAQSWAMVHMFMTGEPNRSKEFRQYLRLTAGGTPAVEAWRQAFGTIDAIQELKRFLRNPIIRGFRFTFDERIGPLTAHISKPKASDVDAVLASLQRDGAPQDVKPRLRRAVEMSPHSMLARSLLGVAKVRWDQRADAVPMLFEAAADTSDWLVQYHVAHGLTQIVRSTGERDEKVVATARAALEVVLAARPQLAHALALKAHLQNNLEGAASAARARALAPGREDYVFLEASLRAAAGEFAAARSLLSLLLTPRFPPDVRDNARRLMGQVVRREQALAAGRATTLEPPASSSSGASPAAAPEGTVAVFRRPNRGEQRIEGTLEKIDCAQNGMDTLVLRADGELKRFVAAAFSDIDFVSYRNELTGSINCGDRKPADVVYVTPGVTGRPVAVEFPPAK